MPEPKTPPGERLPRAFFARSPLVVAPALLGCGLWTRRDGALTGGRIVETEAYLGPEDPASHAATRRAGLAIMSGPVGTAYVYRSYGLHAMLNAVAHAPGVAGAVLIRAIEPVVGRAVMVGRRGVTAPRLLCAGPGRLCQALAVRLDDHGRDLVGDDEVWLAAGSPPATIRAGPRIGLARGAEASWRFFVPDSPFVSAHRRGEPLAGEASLHEAGSLVLGAPD